jgi:hypothetical protein
MEDYATVLSSGPLLLFNGDTVAQVPEKYRTPSTLPVSQVIFHDAVAPFLHCSLAK